MKNAENRAKKPKITFGYIVYLAITFISALACGGLAGGLAVENELPGEPEYVSFLRIALFLAMALIAMFFHIIAHEGGHLIFGLLSGYKFSSFRVGNIILVKNSKGWKLGKYSLYGTAGQCLMEPPAFVDGKIPYALYNFGGAAVNIILAVIFGILAFVFKESHMVSGAFSMFCIMGLSAGLSNGIPLSLGSIDNDGRNAFNLGQNPEALKSFWIELKVAQLSAEGMGYNDMPEEYFYVPDEEHLQNAMVAEMLPRYMCRLVYQQRFAEASAFFDEKSVREAEIITINRMMMTCDKIYCELISGNKAVVEELYTKELKAFMANMKGNPVVIRTEFAMALLCDGNKEKSEKILKGFEKLSKTYPYEGELEEERELISIAGSVALEKEKDKSEVIA